MIYYACKYTPIEIIQSFKDEAIFLDPSVESFGRAESLTHGNMCSYSKAALQYILEKEISSIVFTDCCDSIRRLYDVVKEQPFVKYAYILSLPRKTNEQSINLYEKELQKFIISLESLYGQKFDIKALSSLSALSSSKPPLSTTITGVALGDASGDAKPTISVMGGRFSDSLLKAVKSAGGEVHQNLTCTGEKRDFKYSTLNEYAKSLLSMNPCMRMIDKNRKIGDSMGIIYHTVKFCDMYSFEYAKLKSQCKSPILKLETDYTSESSGQIKTRLEAFVESLKSSNNFEGKQKSPEILIKDKKYVLGIDSGSTSTNAVILDKDKNIVSYYVLRTGAKSIESASKAVEEVLKSAGLTRSSISILASTGYGRYSIPFADMNITEITCHGKGANYFNKNVRTIIDIGGQDSKIIKINQNGDVLDFVMNDKCAAGTGRFLEMMARTLEIPIENMGEESLNWKEDITISSMCTVFAESEVISLIAQNKEKCDIIHGLNNSIASRIYSLSGRVKREKEYMMTGGVALNKGVVKAIEEKLNSSLIVSKTPDIVGALGAAILSLEST